MTSFNLLDVFFIKIWSKNSLLNNGQSRVEPTTNRCVFNPFF